MTEQTTELVPAEAVAVERAMRADARRNRERILEAARLAYAEHGRDVQIDECRRSAPASASGLSTATFRRRRRSRARSREHFEALCVIAQAALDAPGTPGERFESLIWDAARLAGRDAAIAEVMAGEPAVFDYVQEPLERLRDSARCSSRRSNPASSAPTRRSATSP